jgi:hypothetical protein
VKELSKKAIGDAVTTWKRVIVEDIGHPVPIDGILVDEDATYYPSISLDELGVWTRRIWGVQYGLMGGPTALASPTRADLYLGKAYTVGLYSSRASTFPLGSNVSFDVCSTRDYCRECNRSCARPPLGPQRGACALCKGIQCASGSSRARAAKAGEALLTGSSSSHTLPAVPEDPAVTTRFELPPSIVSPDASLAYKYGATIAMSRWYQGYVPRNGSSGPIMACYLDKGCSLDAPPDGGCNISQAYLGFLVTLAKTGKRPSSDTPVAFLA